MKKGLIILIVAIAIAGALYFLYTLLRKNISFDFNIAGDAGNILGLLTSRYAVAQRSNVSSSGVENKAGLYFDIPITTIVKNAGAAKVVLQNIAGSVSYDGEPILQTKANSPALATVEVAKKDSKPITDNVQLLVNESTIKFFKELVQGKKPSVIYNFSTVIAGKPKNFTNSTQVNKTT